MGALCRDFTFKPVQELTEPHSISLSSPKSHSIAFSHVLLHLQCSFFGISFHNFSFFFCISTYIFYCFFFFYVRLQTQTFSLKRHSRTLMICRLPVSRSPEVSQMGESGSRLDYILSHVDSISDSIYEPSALSCSRGFRSAGPEAAMVERRAHASTTSGPIRRPACKPQV